MSKTKKILGVLIFIGVFAAAVAVVMLLWNALIPSIIGWTSINYLQAAGLMILCRLLFGGFKHHRHGFFRRQKSKHRKMHMEMRNMSRDERREFIRKRMLNTFDKFCDEDTDTSSKPDNE